MSERTVIRKLSLAEFAALMAAMISMTALAIDIMLPVIDVIAVELGARGENAAQLIIIYLFIGLAIGQLLYGPVSDTVGRKPAIAAGFVVFIFGTLICIFARDYDTMLLGRFLQGLGAAAPRIIAMSIVRDLYSGREMAKVSSVIMGFFIMVPAIAPAIGQAIVSFAPWRMIFYALLGQALLVGLWFALRQNETLHPEYRRDFSLKKIALRGWEVLTTPISFWYTLAAGIIFGAFVGYLVSSPQIFEDVYGIKEQFPLYFGGLALMIGSAALFNARLVMRFGMRKLCLMSVSVQIVVSVIFFIYAYSQAGHIPLPAFMVWAAISFFMMGFLFGNFNAIALEPLGHIAGIGAAIVGSLSTFISLGLGWLIGQVYNQTVLPIIGSYALLGLASFAIMKWADR